MSCAICGGGPSHPKLRTGGTDVAECLSCGVQSWDAPAGLRASDTHDEAYFESPAAGHGYDDYGALEASLRRNFARRLARLAPPGPHSRLLDLGAAYGFAVAEARRAGWLAVGVDVSRAATRRATSPSRGCLAVADGSRLPFRPGSFDAVTMWDVLEHLHDPHAAVESVAALLRPGGRLVLTTGDAASAIARLSGARWHLYSIPEHLYFYTRRSLEVLLSAHGLRVESMRADGSVYTLGYVVERLRKTLLGRPAHGPSRWPGAQLQIPVNLFDIVTVSAVRCSQAEGPGAVGPSANGSAAG